MTTQNPAQDVSDALRQAAIVLELWEGEPDETGYMGDFNDAAQILLILADHAARELQQCPNCLNDGCHCATCNPFPGELQAQVVGDGVLATLDRVIDAVDKYPATTLVRQDWGDTLREVRAALTTCACCSSSGYWLQVAQWHPSFRQLGHCCSSRASVGWPTHWLRMSAARLGYVASQAKAYASIAAIANLSCVMSSTKYSQSSCLPPGSLLPSVRVTLNL